MPVPIKYKYTECVRAIEKIAEEKGFELKIINKRGTGRRFELFDKNDSETPKDFWVFHESRYIYTRDLKKIYKPLGITSIEFNEFMTK